MSRREGRDSDSRHHRSRLDREPSPKRARRDGRTTTERSSINHNLDSSEHTNRDKKHSTVPDSKIETVPLTKESEKKSNGYRERRKNSPENIEPHRSRSHFQQGQVGRSFRHNDTTERGWWKDRESGSSTTNRSSNDDSKQPSKKRPSFRETKEPPVDGLNGDKSAAVNGSEKKEEGGKPADRRDPQRMKFQSRERFGGWNRGRGGQKWKHDLYDEANKSPRSKNEEDQIAKVEALLAS